VRALASRSRDFSLLRRNGSSERGRATRKSPRHSSPWVDARVASLRSPVFRPGIRQYMSNCSLLWKSIASDRPDRV
jgi:hypothetical protein